MNIPETDDVSRALVTGVTGFIGQVLCRRLQASGRPVRALVRSPQNGVWDDAVACELGREPLPNGAVDGIDTIFHLAGVAHTWGASDNLYRQVNVDGTRALLDATIEAGVKRFVFFSSVKAVADPPPDKCVDENWTGPPSDAYGRSKREAEELVLAAAREHGFHAVVLRPTLVYGPGVKGNLARIIRLVASGRSLPLPDTGNRRSMVHVDDLVELAMIAAVSPAASGQCYIAADEGHHSTRELYVGLCTALDKSVPDWQLPAGVLRFVGRLGDLASTILHRPLPINSDMISRLLNSACYSGRRAMQELGWQPRHDLLANLPDMVEAWRETL